MDLQEFEQLWQERDNLSPEMLKKVEAKRLSCPDCKAFAEGGDLVRNLLMNYGKTPAVSENFAYRMRVYASNHKVEEPSIKKSGFKWASLALGITTGAAIVAISAGPLNQNSSFSQNAAFSENSNSRSVNMALKDSLSDAENLLASEEDDSLKAELEREGVAIPSWQTRTVSTPGR